MNIFLNELKMNKKLTIAWSSALAILTIFFLSIFPSFANNSADWTKLLEGFPEGVRKAVGISLESITSLLGFYAYIFTYVTLAGSIQAMILGISIISEEVRDKTADFLLTKPVSRPSVLTAKLLSALTSLAITNTIFIVIANLMAQIVSSGYDLKIFLLLSSSLFLIQLMFFAFGFLISAIMTKVKSAVAISLGTVFTFFIISGLGSVLGEERVNYITPFKYYDPSKIIQDGSFDFEFIIIEAIFIAVALFISYVIYTKKDIDAV